MLLLNQLKDKVSGISMKNKYFLIISVVLFLTFVFFSKYVKAGHLKLVDFDTTIRVQNHIPVRLDEFMADGAILADPLVSTLLVLLVTGVVFVRGRGKRRFLALGIPLAFAVLTLIEIYGKNFVPHPGPPFFMVKHPTTIFPEFTVIQPYSYPSGHMARITFLGVVLLSLAIKRFGNLTISLIKKKPGLVLGAVFIVGYIIFIAVSRIYLGHHWLSDILGGAFLGASAGLVALSCFDQQGLV